MESVSLTFTVVNDAVPDYCPFCVNFIRKTFFLSKTIIFSVIFHCSNHAKSYRVFITIKPHCCSLSNIKTLVLSYIEHTRITIEYSQLLISDYYVITDIKLLSFIF